MIKKISYKDQVYEHMKRAIMDGTLKVGEIYSEQMMADELEVSRTPVREAVLQLKNEKLIEIYNNRGFGVRPVSVEDIRQIIQARTAIESYTLALLAESIGTEEGRSALDRMESCLKVKMGTLREDKEHINFMQADMEFHAISIIFTQNEYFISMYHNMRAQLERVTVSSLENHGRHADALREHEAIFKAVSQGRAREAGDALKKHMLVTEDLLIGHRLT
ncbi:DNA-binding transcriptional regulator, GntR family [Selenomonas ruminantium]|uniref:DNA-binding transcriptional regulator, GntR family n=1 Tax=Selenomonas ruminantium TaxID=971 RepID=A0A1M6XK81_SELRU|nr:GntR family transcriptional regulator [Selenomonas ruminantium]SHL06412.1 DNA-binding transcriptional regulator, GntR family [Selenomonas ruminantium]